MNLAFHVLVILLLLLPGIVFQSSYNGRLSKDTNLPINFPSLTLRAVQVFVTAAILHATWIPVSNLFGEYVFSAHVDLYSTIYLIAGEYSDTQTFEDTLLSVINFPLPIFVYFFSISLFAIAAGLGLHKLIRKLKLDIKFPLFRFNNEWHYLFWGEILSFPENDRDPIDFGKIDGTAISVVIESDKTSYLYVGILEDYLFDRQGNLERIILGAVQRRELINDRVQTEEGESVASRNNRYYDVDGDYFVVRYSDVKSMNIKYLVISKHTENEDQAE